MEGVGIDLGMANTVLFRSSQGVILDEPSMMALRVTNPRRPKLVALGHEARQLLGRTPLGVTIARPLQDGMVTDLETARRYIAAVVRRVAPRWWQRRRLPAVIGVPVGATPLERRALLEAVDEAGIHDAHLVAEPIAAALGCGIDPLEPRARLVVDVGGGTAEVAAFSFGGLLAYRSCPLAGDEMTLAVYQHLRNEHQLVVGELVAENVKIRASTDPSPSVVVEGRDAATGRARLVTMEVEEVLAAIRPVVDTIIQTLAACLEDLPPQAVSDVLADGVLATGGGSLLVSFDKLLEEAFGFSVRLADRPLTCVAEGAALCLTRRDVLTAYTPG